MLACQSILQSLEVLDRHFSLGKTERLAELEETMVAILIESVAAAGRCRRAKRCRRDPRPAVVAAAALGYDGPSGLRSEAV